ncbi:MAG: xanthine dehydrogenase family protein molybdopterin-binding subunit [Telluria sp.]|nr:xanthine dehydrogenase family protein molybdopterin-binding subunit [Telluria sp.]
MRDEISVPASSTIERAGKYVGKRVQRTEDEKLLRGQGQYVDDLKLENVLYSALCRSPHAHARIVSVDTAAARALPGVRAVYLHADLPPSAQHRLPLLVPNPAIRAQMTQEVLASTEVCSVGDPIAFVVADSRHIAEDACALIDVEYDVLPVVADASTALAAGMPLMHTSLESNLAAQIKMGFGEVGKAFESAAHVVRETFWQNRGSAHPMETRGYAAEYHAVTGQLTVWSAGQAPFLEKKNLIEVLDWDPERLRIIMNDVGGGFGPKVIFYPEEALVAIAAWKLGRPVKWIEDRREHFFTATQERDQWWDISLALTAQGRILGIKLDMTHDNGAYLPWGIIMPYIAATTTPGPYVIPAMDVDVKVVFTNKGPTSPVRGAGRPQAVFAMERILDKAARTMGVDRAELRRRNLIGPEQMPYSVGFIYRDGKPLIYDSGDYPRCQAEALARADYDGFAARKAAARLEGRYLGIGMANYVEGTGLGPFEGATVRVQQNGRISILTGAAPQGQGHKTTFAQICADQLGVPMDHIDVITADTNTVSMGIGTFASRITVTAGSSVHLAAQAVRDKVARLAAFMLGCEADQITLDNGFALVTGEPERRKSFAELARVSQGMPGFSFPAGVTNGLEDTQYFSPSQSTYCNGTAVVELELDRDTGQIQILHYVMAHDCGKLINPMIVDGQIQGAIAHGIGNATLEWMRYDDQAQPITTNFGEYLLPMATDVPNADIVHIETASPLNPLGVKGAGEGGTIPAAAAIIGAIEDALSDTGVFLTDSPMTPPRLFEVLSKAGVYK